MAFGMFVFGDTLGNAIEAIPEEHQLRYYKYIKDYGLHGIEPDLSGFELATWVQMKTMIDITMPKKNNHRTGKNGAPFGNNNASKNRDISENMEKQPKTTETTENNSNNRLNDNGNVNENVNVNNQNGVENKTPQSLFLYYWQHNPDIFDFQARIENYEKWEKFWKQSHFTCSQIKTAMNNFILDVKEGIIERKYIPLLPDRFVLNGWITKCQERLKPDKPTEKIFGKSLLSVAEENYD